MIHDFYVLKVIIIRVIMNILIQVSIEDLLFFIQTPMDLVLNFLKQRACMDFDLAIR